MGEKTSKPTVLISDLGNVLAFFDHRTIVKNLAAYMELDASDIFFRFVASDIHSKYVLGRIDDESFYDRAKKLFNLPNFPDFQTFAKAWSDIFSTNRPMVNTLRRVTNKLILVLLSNTNNLHFRWIEKHHPEIIELFGERLVLSHQVGAAKPDERIYKVAIQTAGTEIHPADCLYIDDIAEYVGVAESLGMRGHQYNDHKKFTEWLETVLN